MRLAKRTSNLFRPRDAVASAGLDVSGLDGVISVDPEARTADVQGMCTYEDLVDATLPHGLIPFVVPQLRTITLGGAVTGLGIESTSFRNGLPHESVLEMDVFTGAGEVVTCTPDNEHADLFATFPNSYGSLGYATRLRIELEPVRSHVALRHVRFTDTGCPAGRDRDDHRDRRVARRAGRRARRHRVRAGGVLPDPGRWTDATGPTQRLRRPADLLALDPAARDRPADHLRLPVALGHRLVLVLARVRRPEPVVRRFWPRRLQRSDVYHRLVGLDLRFGIADRLDRRAGRPQRERVIQDIEVPVERLGEFLDWFDAEVGMRPVWLCPLRLRGETSWPSYPLEPGRTYVNVGFWGAVPVGDDAPNSPLNRAIEAKVAELDGHKSLYSESFYDPATFDRLYDGANLAAVKKRYDPDDRLTSLYDKAVRQR